jgi:two-component system osmolarity sensor histidine kinase EnvZ
MLEGYIDFAKGDADEPVQLLNVCDVLERHSMEATLRDKDYQIDCPSDLTIEVRPNAFSRLVANIVTNGFRYADKLSVKAFVRGEKLTIQFDDDGPGISEKMREEVFKPFMRLDEARNLDESGTGLGLSIARDIARNHGGDINLYESPAGGLRAIVVLPV